MALAIALALALALPAAADAQESPALARGARVRVTTFDPAAAARTGIFERWTGSALLVYQDDVALTFPIDDVDVLEVSAGRSFGTVGAVLGGLVGAVAGGALGCAANRDDYGVYCGGQSDTKVFVGAALGGVAGAALGGILSRTERWVPVPLLDLDRLR